MAETERMQDIWRLRVACWVSKLTRAQAHAHTQKYLIRIASHSNNSLVKAPLCYVTRILPILFKYMFLFLTKCTISVKTQL
jgi:hypothetical protein